MRAVHLLLLLLLVAPRVAAQPPLLRPLVVRADQRSPFALPAKHGSLGCAPSPAEQNAAALVVVPPPSEPQSRKAPTLGRATHRFLSRLFSSLDY